MKDAHSPRGGSALMLGIACLGLSGQVFAQNNEIPRGTLAVDSQSVRVGIQPQLSWQIPHHGIATDLIEISPAAVTAKTDLHMRVRILGSTLGQDNSGASGEPSVEIVWSRNASPWACVFHGPPSAAIATDVVLDTVIAKSDVLDFGVRARPDGQPPFACLSGNGNNVFVLKNGDPVPPQISIKPSELTGGFLEPYLSTDARSVKTGDGELLILMKTDPTEHHAAGRGCREIGLLVTFESSPL